ncbi:ABC transporter permease [Arthrobacter mangrovi]|uniref:Exporter of polyketide antibiotics n=1 Tax=Arthrobacter mangrovi TaxID=2966350 RepID=A0ABQ5MWB3_9MICC|nr:polyketide antibiotic transporter [Arthrobacter mangrovi]GLB68281.1 exporter of polyketide antibiotics [Arthrobacter mangrovi]
MASVLRLLRAQARRDRWQLLAWIAGIGLLGLAIAGATASQFGSEAGRAAIVAVAAGSPAFLFLRGVPDGYDAGAFVFFNGFSFTAVLTGLMSTFLVVRHSRADEESGRAELVGAAPVPRSAPLAATLLLGLLANLLLAAAVALGYLAGGLPAGGSGLAGLAVGSVGLFFVGAAALVAQLMPSGHAANGTAAALVGLAYLVRGTGDAFGTPDATLSRVEPAWPSWFSPIGWGQLTRPFTEADPVPLLVLVGVAVLLAAVVLPVRGRRDLGASLLAERAGRPAAGFGGRSLLGLAWRLQRSTLAGWAVAAAVLGLLSGALGPVLADAVAGNPSLAELIARLAGGSAPAIADVFIAALLGITGVLAAAAGVQAVLRLRAEEEAGRLELLLALPRSRPRWFGAGLSVAAFSVLAVTLAAGLAAGTASLFADAPAAGPLTGTAAGGPDSADRFWLLVASALAHLPAALVMVALAALAFAALPRLAVALGWGPLVLALVLGQFGGLLNLPEWAQDLSPFHHSSAMPVEDFAAAPALTMLAAVVVLALAATFMLRHRDLGA